MRKKQIIGFGCPVLEGEDAKRFNLQDQLPLTRKQKEHLKQCILIYQDNPIE